MERVSLTDTPSRAQFFQKTVLKNLHYWQSWLKTSLADTAVLDRERNAIAKAISFALNLEEAWPSVFALITTLSPVMERRGHWDLWHWILTHALDTAWRFEDNTAEVTLSALLARLLFQQSRYKESVAYYRRTIHLARQIGDQFNEARACTNLGYYYVEQGYWRRAELLCCHALAIFEQLDSDHGRAHTENHLGRLYVRQHRWDQAQYHLKRACSIWQTMGDQHGLMRGFLNLGSSYVDSNQPHQALSYLEKALHQAQLTGEIIAVGTIYTNMGKAYRLIGDWVQAEAHTRQAEVIFQQYSNLAELSRAWNGLGLIYFQQDRWPEAMTYLEKSLQAWRSLGIKSEEIEVLLDIGECELSKGDQFQAIVRLQEIEQLIGQAPEQGPYRHFLPRLAHYRNSLVSSIESL